MALNSTNDPELKDVEDGPTRVPSSQAQVIMPWDAIKDDDVPAPSPVYDGRDAWLTVLGVWLIQFCILGLLTAFGVYQEYYTLVYMTDYSASTISWIGGLQLLLQLVLGSLSGTLLDRGHMRSLFSAGCLLFVFCCFMLSLCRPGDIYQVFLCQAIGMGIAVGLLYLSTISLVGAHFRKWKALAMGIILTGGSFGGAVFSILLNQLFNGSIGFAWGNRVIGFICLVFMTSALFLLRPPPHRRLPTANKPQVPLRVVLNDSNYWIAVAAGACIAWGVYVPLFYIQLFGQTHGINPHLAFYSIAILNLSSCFGRTVPNFLADRFGIFKVFIPLIVASGAISFGVLGCTTPAGIVLVAIFYGFFSGAAVALYFPMLSSLQADPSTIGKRIGISGIPLGICFGTGPPIAGALIGTEYFWYKGMIWATVTQLVGAALVAFLGLRVRRSRSD